MINICGKGDAEADIEAYYDDWELKYPWNIPPKRLIKIVEQEETDSEESSSVTEAFTSQDSGVQSSLIHEMVQLREQNAMLTKQMTDMMKLIEKLNASKAQESA